MDVSADPRVAELVARLRDLRLTPRREAGGLGVGQHASRSRGAGLEFSQYRAYEQGDEPRRIDWRLYARSDRFFVRESERESPLTLWLLLDASASMAQADDARPDWRRFDAARTIAAALADHVQRQGDRVGLAVLHDAGLRLVAAGQGPRQRDRIRLALRALQAGGGVPAERQLLPLWERIGPRDMVLLLSDCFDPQLVALVERLARAGRDALVLQLLTVAERDFPFDGGHEFHDPESGQRLLGDGATLRDDYLRRFGDAQQALRSRLAGAGARYACCCLDEPLDRALRRLFDPRALAGGR